MIGNWAESQERAPARIALGANRGGQLGSICLLGAPRLLLPDGRVHALERHDAALLALLALQGPTLRARAAALLWQVLSDSKARGNLRQRLFRMQRLACGYVACGNRALCLDDAVVLDLREARAALGADPQACAGELLGIHDYSESEVLDEWVRSARSDWRRMRLETLAEEASRREAARRIAAALP